ncbi:MAG: Holliday junction branch migration protein RuvA [Gammaproteobacteria bacterium]|nr:Holliday junction branch migration protein RuvA [Gammaproteobacteria bacterium]|tara:strand:- start:539 stop:1129 length:591 start_codon:yes stop_codon:yes gene_type:complete
MISSLRGKLVTKMTQNIVIECNGIGYEVETPMSTFLELPIIDTDLFLYTHLLIREDAQILYGFSTQDERHMFRKLLKVNRVGAKLALGILSAMSISDFKRLVELEDAISIAKIPGVGKKTSERLIIEMRDQINTNSTEGFKSTSFGFEVNPRAEALDALIGLGYKTKEINNLIAKLDIENKTTEDIIRLALKQAAK